MNELKDKYCILSTDELEIWSLDFETQQKKGYENTFTAAGNKKILKASQIAEGVEPIDDA